MDCVPPRASSAAAIGRYLRSRTAAMRGNRVRIPSVMTTHNRVICVAHGCGRRQAPRATKGAVLLGPARGLGARRELGADLDGGASWLVRAADRGRVLEPDEKGRTPAKSPLAADVPVR